ncbi:MAG: hypothetical protein P4M12_09675 [Gammaproteobacteria bacterium]|nr:hypothetical protein [Gammaproteobacteria bacterium]
MLRSRIVLSCLALISVLSLSACMTVAQEPTRVPVIFAPAPSYMSHDYGYYGYHHCYKHCRHHHGMKSCHYRCGSLAVNRGYYGCTGYLPAFHSENRVCSKWEYMPGTCAMYK